MFDAVPVSAQTCAFTDGIGPTGPQTPVEVLSPRHQTAPLVFSSPHSGRAYPPSFVAASGLDPLILRRSEDFFVDLLFAAAPAFGAPLVKANFPRAFVDANRGPYELDPEMFLEPLPDHVITNSPRVAAGLGTIARVVARGVEIYREKMTFAQAQARIEACYHPYHGALERLVAATRDRFGACIVIDCHSMPSPSAWPGDAAVGPGPGMDFVLGDANGKSCDPRVIDLAEKTLSACGYSVRRNVPYPGGFITSRYGRPEIGLHSLQIEISRAIYMDERRFVPSPGWAGVAADLGRLVERLCRQGGEICAALEPGAANVTGKKGRGLATAQV